MSWFSYIFRVAPGQGPGGKDTAIDAQLREQIRSTRVTSAAVKDWEDIVGLDQAKQVLKAAVKHFTVATEFTTLKKPKHAILLHGPPGTGKTILAEALSGICGAVFYKLSAAKLTNMYHGNDCKLAKILFEEARNNQPAIVFIDEIDSLLLAPNLNEDLSTRQFRTEFNQELQDLFNSHPKLLVIGATNEPDRLNDASINRFFLILVPLPNAASRRAQLAKLLDGHPAQRLHPLSSNDIDRVVSMTEGFSGRLLDSLCQQAYVLAESTRADFIRFCDLEKASQDVQISKNVSKQAPPAPASNPAQPAPLAQDNRMSAPQLYYAAAVGAVDKIKALPNNFNVDILHKSVSALHIASKEGQCKAVVELLRRGANVCLEDDQGDTALHHAVWHGHRDIARLLVEHGADMFAVNKNNYSVVQHAKRHGDIQQDLKDRGADDRGQTLYRSWPPIAVAAKIGDSSYVKALVAHNVNVNVKDPKGDTALMHAAWEGHLGIVEALLRAGAHKGAANNNGYTAFDGARDQGKWDVLQRLQR